MEILKAIIVALGFVFIIFIIYSRYMMKKNHIGEELNSSHKRNFFIS